MDLIPVTAGSAKNKVVLGRLPNGALKLSPDDFVNTIYTVVNDDTKGSLPYLVAKENRLTSSQIPLRQLITMNVITSMTRISLMCR